jgi:uncharacterized protein
LTPRSLVFGPNGALLAPWRLALFTALTLVAWVTGVALIGPLLAVVFEAAGVQLSVEGLAGVAALLIAHTIMLRFVDRAPWSSVWLGHEAARPWAWMEGWVVGAVSIGVPCAALLAAHELRMIPSGEGSWLAAAARVSWTLLPAALMEELLTRGYVLRVLVDAWGARGALIGTSVVFGLLHLGNPGANAQSVAVVVLAGLFLGMVVLATRSLYAGWMAHFAWNWVQAVPLHSAVSGIPLESPNYQLMNTGPAWLTGGGWGPEGGVAAAAGMLMGITFLYTRRNRREGL